LSREREGFEMRRQILVSPMALTITALPIAVVGSSPASAAPSCTLANGVQHVVEITFDNVHILPRQPERPVGPRAHAAPQGLHREQRAMLSNNHTPLIAHTAEDSLAIYTGLYGDRHGMPISNSYRTYNADGTTNGAGSFVYWTDPRTTTAATTPSTR
jgi:hypothetical protein